MFQWSITLSDKQVIMLAAFNVAECDKHGSQFHAVNSMVGDAWDCRAVRKLEEMNLISVTHNPHPDTGLPNNIWIITQKGRMIASAINCDAENLKQIQLRNGVQARMLINASGDERYYKNRKRLSEKQKNKYDSILAKVQVPKGWSIVKDGNDRVGDKYFSLTHNDWRVVIKRRKKSYQYRLLIRKDETNPA